MVELFVQKVESAQDRDNAVQQNDAAKAAVKAQEAAVRQSEINLGWTKLKAPVTGIAGIANVNVGDLVSPTDANPVVTISTVDPIKAYFQLSEQDYLKAQETMERDSTGKVVSPPVEMILADGTLYPEKGKFSAVDRQVDAQTGTIRLAALFPNPQNILRPGQFVRVRVTVRIRRGALVVPQRAVNQLQTSYEVAVVGAHNKAEIRSVRPGDVYDSNYYSSNGDSSRGDNSSKAHCSNNIRDRNSHCIVGDRNGTLVPKRLGSAEDGGMNRANDPVAWIAFEPRNRSS